MPEVPPTLLVFLVAGLAGCSVSPEPRGPLMVAGDGWMQRLGSPASYLEKQVQSLTPGIPTAADKRLFARYGESRAYWAPNWLWKLDFTGIAWDAPQAGTLVHPRYVVFASHFPRRRGRTVLFHDRAGQPVRRKIVASQRINRIATPDVTIARLDRPVPQTIAHYPLLPPGYDYRLLNGGPLLVTDKERQIHRFQINRIRQTGFGEIGARPPLEADAGMSWHERLERGDSGHPAFVVIDGRLVLISILQGGGWAFRGPFFGCMRLQDALITAIHEMERRHPS